MEGLPSIVAGIVVLTTLADSPLQVRLSHQFKHLHTAALLMRQAGRLFLIERLLSSVAGTAVLTTLADRSLQVLQPITLPSRNSRVAVFLMEGLPSIVASMVVLSTLADSPLHVRQRSHHSSAYVRAAVK